MERTKVLQWQIALTAEVAYRDPDPEKRRAFVDLHAERVALYTVLREHENDADPNALAVALDTAQRRLRALRSPGSAAWCKANPKDPVCGLP